MLITLQVPLDLDCNGYWLSKLLESSRKWRKWRKHSKFRDNWISDADVVSFSDRLKTDFKRKNMWEQLKSGKLLMILNNCVTDFVFHHEAFGADQGEEDCTYNGFGDRDDKMI